MKCKFGRNVIHRGCIPHRAHTNRKQSIDDIYKSTCWCALPCFLHCTIFPATTTAPRSVKPACAFVHLSEEYFLSTLFYIIHFTVYRPQEASKPYNSASGLEMAKTFYSTVVLLLTALVSLVASQQNIPSGLSRFLHPLTIDTLTSL